MSTSDLYQEAEDAGTAQGTTPDLTINDYTQGYIMTGHGRNVVWHGLIRFREDVTPAAVRNTLREIAAQGVTSTASLLADKKSRREKQPDAKKALAGLVVGALGVSWSGYRAMGFNPVGILSPELRDGFAARAETVTGRGTNEWDARWKQRRYDVILILAAGPKDDPQGAEEQLLEWQGIIDGLIAGKAQIEWLKGKIKRNGNTPVENFGFRDGVSQPDPQVALVHEPFREHDSEYGSYLAFVDIEQHPDRFREAADELAGKLYKTLRPAPSQCEHAKALIMGRAKNGVPTSGFDAAVLKAKYNGAAPDADTLSNKELNELGVQYDDGSKWAFASHIRKMNPREAGQEHHRILRRSAVYELADRLGVFFQCFNTDLQEQFEFLLQRWGNYRSQPNKYCGVDPLMGFDPKRHPQEWPVPGESGCANVRIHSITTIRGGDYFYFPSIPFLKSLSGLSEEDVEKWTQRASAALGTRAD